MTTDEKLTAILAAVQTDPGNRGLAKVPGNNLFTETAGDFQAACRSIAKLTNPAPMILTGFIIPSVDPPTFETDGPLGAVFLARALLSLEIWNHTGTDEKCHHSIASGLNRGGIPADWIHQNERFDEALWSDYLSPPGRGVRYITHVIAIERPGPSFDGRMRTMRGRDITEHMLPAHHLFVSNPDGQLHWNTIGIGDGGNEIGMGKIPHETIVANIPNGDLIHCRVPTDHLIVAGVSNWGAYALAAGVFVLKGVKPPDDLFDPDRERAILEVMVREGPLVDGVTGKQTATVDGLTWDEYAKPLIRIREILES